MIRRQQTSAKAEADLLPLLAQTTMKSSSFFRFPDPRRAVCALLLASLIGLSGCSVFCGAAGGSGGGASGVCGIGTGMRF
ncbi:hypothetical protein F4827_001422 [Paraburkholderia bannensis]|uniref:Uncharacterized protein n=1 Tax=Paraburkholderia bannensis TaxID=765414 RepID=A0A7W9TUB9_9BURK|nr:MULTISPECIES: hypothetical protein [Paraburkholderia]MBB3256589.1 hypothetical protein [Paraburkholderia sp. WP4_3_2]MBB6101588.1 hypothetical protein [Paraburkholderia bannensis]